MYVVLMRIERKKSNAEEYTVYVDFCNLWGERHISYVWRYSPTLKKCWPWWPLGTTQGQGLEGDSFLLILLDSGIFLTIYMLWSFQIKKGDDKKVDESPQAAEIIQQPPRPQPHKHTHTVSAMNQAGCLSLIWCISSFNTPASIIITSIS